MDEKLKGRLAVGIALIVLGLGIYGLQYLDDVGESVTLTLLGGLCIAGYLSTRNYFLLVLGGIVVGLGIGSFGERLFFVVGEFWKLGLGIGFVLIYLIALLYERRSHWWPLIPGLILILLGLQAWRSFRTFIFGHGWPLILVIVGALIILGSIGRSRKDGKPAKS